MLSFTDDDSSSLFEDVTKVRRGGTEGKGEKEGITRLMLFFVISIVVVVVVVVVVIVIVIVVVVVVVVVVIGEHCN